ncbi:MAG: hypothetical protein V4844_02845 [Pseudomonadota bacterium]
MGIDFDAAEITNPQLKRAALLAAQQLAAAHQIVRSNPRLMQGADPLVLATIALTIATNLGPMDLAIGTDPGFDPTVSRLS